MELNKDFKEFIALLNAHEVQYLVIGGYAVNYHGYPRYTRDIDFWVWMTNENVGRLLNALHDFGFGSLGLKAADFMDPDLVIQLGHEPYRIDILVAVEGAAFDACYARRSETVLDGVAVNFLSAEDLIRVKRETARLQDLADAEQIERILNIGRQNAPDAT
ncbi:MAG: nucleotidyl transferase AbiEii/AbiGii toxin family protein [Rhodothermales bacterium]